jgi:hypothetical protein
MKFDKVEKYRARHPMGFQHRKGDRFGWFEIPTSATGPKLRVMVAPSDDQWQHVSVSLASRCPTWDEMCLVKDLFFEDEDVVVQFHPKKTQYVNNAKYCLHLWKLNDGREFPTPASILVGYKDIYEVLK